MARWLLVSSSGGHLAHLWWLRALWGEEARLWVTFDTPDARGRLVDEQVVWAHHPTNRNLVNLARNTRLAGHVLASFQPDLVLTTGAGVALPFVGLAAAAGIPTVYIEVFDRIDRPSWTARALSAVVDRMVLQWPEQREALGVGVVLGAIR